MDSGLPQPEVDAQTGLSEREKEVLLLAADGLTDKEIARKLDIGAKTVRTYWDRMRQKMDAASRTQVLAKALRLSYEGLAESEERWRKIVESMPMLFIAFDESGAVVYINEEAQKVTGYDPSEIQGQNLFSRMFPRCDKTGPDCFSESDMKGRKEQLVCSDGAVRELIWYSAAGRAPVNGWTSWIIGIEPEEEGKSRSSVERAVRLL